MKKSENRKEMFDKYFKLSSVLSKVANDFEHACKFGNCTNHDEYEYCYNRSKHYFTLSQFSCWYAYKFYSDFRKETWREWKSYNDIPRYITLKNMLNEINGL